MTSAAGAPRSLAGLRRHWTQALVVGELVGFVAPAVTGATPATVGAPDALLTGRTLRQLLARDDGRPASGGAGRSALPRRRAGADDDASDQADRGGEQPAAVGTP